MATSLKVQAEVENLGEAAAEKKAGIVVAKWHADITSVLAEGAKKTLKKAGFKEENILIHEVPGAFELPLGAQFLIEYSKVDLAICIGCLVKGETPHFHYISDAVTNSISRLSLQYVRPVAYGVLTVDTIEQAKDRAGGKHGNKGEEAAQAAVEMLNLKEKLKHKKEKQSIGFSK